MTGQEYEECMRLALKSSRYFTFIEPYLDIVSHRAAIILQQIINLDEDEEGWALCTVEFMQKKGRIDHNGQHLVLTELKKEGLIEVIRRGVPGRRYVRVLYKNLYEKLLPHLRNTSRRAVSHLENKITVNPDDQSVANPDDPIQYDKRQDDKGQFVAPAADAAFDDGVSPVKQPKRTSTKQSSTSSKAKQHVKQSKDDDKPNKGIFGDLDEDLMDDIIREGDDFDVEPDEVVTSSANAAVVDPQPQQARAEPPTSRPKVAPVVIIKQPISQQTTSTERDAAVKLHAAVFKANKIQRKASIPAWTHELSVLLKELAGDVQRFTTVLNWYCQNIGAHTVPEVYSASGFRQRFDAIERAMHRIVGVPVTTLTDKERKLLDFAKSEFTWQSAAALRILPKFIADTYRTTYEFFVQIEQARKEGKFTGKLEYFREHLLAQWGDPYQCVQYAIEHLNDLHGWKKDWNGRYDSAGPDDVWFHDQGRTLADEWGNACRWDELLKAAGIPIPPKAGVVEFTGYRNRDD